MKLQYLKPGLKEEGRDRGAAPHLPITALSLCSRVPRFSQKSRVGFLRNRREARWGLGHNLLLRGPAFCRREEKSRSALMCKPSHSIEAQDCRQGLCRVSPWVFAPPDSSRSIALSVDEVRALNLAIKRSPQEKSAASVRRSDYDVRTGEGSGEGMRRPWRAGTE